MRKTLSFLFLVAGLICMMVALSYDTPDGMGVLPIGKVIISFSGFVVCLAIANALTPDKEEE